MAQRLEGEQLDDAVRHADIVLDCSDNFATRHAVNAACVKYGTPLVSGAAVRMEGQVAVYLPQRADSPCYACLYRDAEDSVDQACSDNGVLSPIVGIIGSLQALEALKVILALGDTLCGRLLVFDGLSHEWRSLKVPRDPACPVCSPARFGG